ncbi:hypothetical protein I5Q34_06200 [Streptomyces sp. AV19]|uniref:AMIN-like domain-containing (lipo)protein n=1 Tax=Streptomyces sp. AV19 TaxID=2793068 RepID=UPI0018FEB32A|nr:hypothetical protein [Streptomyces sp. AV19]MBH1933890.1 hypothetical protein [Streptomyces sp. AV19]MDG4535622.1 hypothetical protein [Streptomyces sp. AV19]
MRRFRTALAALVLAGAGLATATGAVASEAAKGAGGAMGASCRIGWGSRTKIRADSEYHPLTDVRAGRHRCFDRMVFDVHTTDGHPIGYRVGYVGRLYQDGSGDTVPVFGGAILEIRVAAPSHDPETGGPRYPARPGRPLPGVDLTGYRTFRDARFGGSFEGETVVGLGVRSRLPFRAFQTGNHVVVDVAHTWHTFR